MRRREFIGLIGGAAAWRPVLSSAQQGTGKLPRIGYLGLGSAAEVERSSKVIETAFRDLGHVVGKSYVIEYSLANGKLEQLDRGAVELVQIPVDVILAPTTAAALAAKRATATIPIVFATVSAPVELGLVSSLARPGGNITGLSYYVSPAIIGKQLQLLNEIHPAVKRVAFIWKPSSLGTQQVAEAMNAATLLGMQLQIIEVHDVNALVGSFPTMIREGTDAVLVLPDPFLSEHRALLGKLALQNRLPIMVGSREDLAPGCLMAYGAGRLDLIRRSITYVDKILKGAKAGELPVEQPTKFELLINLTAAKGLGLSLPSTLLARADEVIE